MLGGRYRLMHPLGAGDLGEVWQAHDDATGHLVVAKIYPSGNNRLADRLMRARSVLMGLWHISIARVQDVLVEGENVCVISDYVAGVNLDQRVADQPLSAVDALEISRVVAGGLSAAHRIGVAHGNLCPSNIIVGFASASATRITDFCVDSLIRAGRARDVESRFTAPEVIDGAVPGPAGDIYALGMVMDLMFGSTSDPHIDSIIDACLDEDPSRRPAADELLTTLEAIPAGPRASSPHSTGGHRAPKGDNGYRAEGDGGYLAQGGGGYRGQGDDDVSGEGAAAGYGAGGYSTGGYRQLELAPRAAGPGSSGTRSSGPRSANRRAQPKRNFGLPIAAVALLVIASFVMFAILRKGDAANSQQPPEQTNPAAQQTITEPALPVAASADTPEGGEAFVKYWFGLLNYGVASGDTSKLTAATRPECTQCNSAIGAIKNGHSNGGIVHGGLFTVRGVTTSSLWTAQRPIFDASVDRSIKTIVDKGGATTGTVAGLAFTNCQIVLQRADNAWRLYEVTTPGCLG